jgi:hypothetical protein
MIDVMPQTIEDIEKRTQRKLSDEDIDRIAVAVLNKFIQFWKFKKGIQ